MTTTKKVDDGFCPECKEYVELEYGEDVEKSQIEKEELGSYRLVAIVCSKYKHYICKFDNWPAMIEFIAYDGKPHEIHIGDVSYEVSVRRLTK